MSWDRGSIDCSPFVGLSGRIGHMMAPRWKANGALIPHRKGRHRTGDGGMDVVTMEKSY